MLNNVLAVCVAGAVVVVIATILGAVELLRKPVAAIAGRWSCWQAFGSLTGTRLFLSVVPCLFP
jgi:hypothetical protein